jgi:hypothetical protein
MKTTDLVNRFLYFGLLLGAVTLSLQMQSRFLASAVVFVVLAVYAQGASALFGLSGTEKGMLFLETSPFLGFACVFFGKSGIPSSLLITGTCMTASAAILMGERLVVKGEGSLASSFAIIALFGLAGLGLAMLPFPLFLGLSLAALVITGYGLARRAQG